MKLSQLSRKTRLYLILTVGTLLLLCCALSMCSASLLPRPDTAPAAWGALAQTASTSRLLAFLATIAFGNGCTGALLPVALTAILLAIIWRTRTGGAR